MILANSNHVMVTRDWSPTYHWRIAEAFDCLEDPTAYGSHCEGPTAVIHDAPGATNRKEKGYKMSQESKGDGCRQKQTVNIECAKVH